MYVIFGIFFKHAVYEESELQMSFFSPRLDK